MISASCLSSVLGVLMNYTGGYCVVPLGLTPHRAVEAVLSALLMSSVCRRGPITPQPFTDAGMLHNIFKPSSPVLCTREQLARYASPTPEGAQSGKQLNLKGTCRALRGRSLQRSYSRPFTLHPKCISPSWICIPQILFFDCLLVSVQRWQSC